ncbi:hypothetical protein Q8791_14735 [Nocardiopsis sp. CT-R113]|uniref:Uncharacterized protein n=1 Tax=Nocardiopsis codii TaxID=3065942 RepID=A0ABU7K8B5_9ACTN|nr:hypothetical protein [Nocardiopsis sp. CT-R113]MEE2038477.1 hypothetical protein [Nocardiopsis sp. CT-R113]
MSRAESGYGRRGRRGGSRRAEQAYTEDHADDYGHDEGREDDYDPEEDFSAEYGHTRTPSEDTADRAGDDEGYDEYDDYEDEDGDGAHAADAEEDTGARRSSRRRKGRGAFAIGASRRKASGARRGGVGKVSAFSASAIKKVSVLGDRPNQIVYTLAEQSKRKRGTAVLGVLLGAFSIALVALLGLLSFQLFTGSGGTVSGGDETVVAPPEGHSTLTPELYLSEPNREDVFGAIDERPEDAEPMTEESVFGSVGEIGLDDMTLELRQSSVTDSCTSLVWGEGLGQSLIDANCVQAATGVYTDSGDDHIAQVTVFDLANVEEATKVEAALDPTNAESGAGFLLTQNGDDIPGLQDGYSQANAQVMGHYLAVFWVADTDGAEPGDNADMAKLSVASMNSMSFVYEEVVAAQRTEE